MRSMVRGTQDCNLRPASEGWERRVWELEKT